MPEHKKIKTPSKYSKGTSHAIGRVSIRKKGRKWYVRYRPYRGAPTIEKSLDVTLYEAARDKAAALSRSLETGQGAVLEAVPGKDRPTVSDLIDLFERTDRRWSDSTRQGNVGRIRLLREEFGPVPLEGFSAHLLSNWLGRRLDTGQISPASYNRYISTVSRISQAGVERGWMQANPAQGVPRLREEPKVPRALEKDELERLLAECAPHVREIVEFASYTGLRRSEIFRLEWRDVKLKSDSGAVTVRKSKAHDWRVVPLPRRIVALLEAKRRDEKDDTVFKFMDIKKGLAAAARRAGLEHVHLHMLRHTYATLLLDLDVGLETIQAALGHKTLAITRRYAKTRPQKVVEAVARLDE
jgi:integrase